MKKTVALMICLGCLFPLFSQVTYNEYGEVKTSITNLSAVLTWQRKDVEDSKDSIVKWLGEGMYYDILNHCTMDEWPDALTPVKDYFANEQMVDDYQVWLVCTIKSGDDAVLRVRAKDNGHMPPGFLPADGSDFYILAFHFGVKDLTTCQKALKNNPAKYPESVYARNYKDAGNTGTATAGEDVGVEELDKGVAEDKKANYAEALSWYKKSAEKGNRIAMYNIGILYYNDRTGKEYSNDDIIFNTLHPGEAQKKRYGEAFIWFKKSADAGFPDGMYAVGLMYREGNGVDKDLTEAKKWFRKAADLGNEDAIEALKEF